MPAAVRFWLQVAAAVSPHAGYASLGLGKAALRNVVEGLAGPLAERGIRIAVATIATLVGPDRQRREGSRHNLDAGDGPDRRVGSRYQTPSRETDMTRPH